MKTAERWTAHDRHFHEMAVWHEWPIEETAESSHRSMRQNVGAMERIAFVLGGGALSAYGVSKKTPVGWGLAAMGTALIARGASGYCPAYQTLGINNRTRGSAEPIDYYENGIQVTRAVTINASPKALYDIWRDFTILPSIMSHVQEVRVIDRLRSHWVVKGPLKSNVEWDAVIINEEPHELIAWRSLPGAEVDNAGSVRFARAPGGRGTQVRVNIEYIPRAGKIGAAIAAMFGEDPNQQVREDLRRFKQIMESGEVPSTRDQPTGQCQRGGSRNKSQRLAAMTPQRKFSGHPNGNGPTGVSRRTNEDTI